jgi:hypothetical protein
LNGGRKKEREKEKKSMIIVVPSCMKDADGARTRSDQNNESTCTPIGKKTKKTKNR